MGERGTATEKLSDDDGHFRRPQSVFRDSISDAEGSKFPPEKDRYVLYVNYGCPWAHRTILVHALKSLEPVIQLIFTDFDLSDDGWLFTGRNGSPKSEPLYGFTRIKQLYHKANADYQGRYSVPVLWDKKGETVVNNESSEIIRMLYTEFDSFLDPQYREINQPGGGFYPENLRGEIDSMNEWVYDTVNNGVYKCGLAGSQEAYDASLYALFSSLDRLEKHLGDPAHQPYLFGEHITEADVRLYTTMARFDVAYFPIFHCNLRMIRHGYPRLYRWLRTLYWDESDKTNRGVFKKTTFFDIYKHGYLRAKYRALYAAGTGHSGKTIIIPRGPFPDIDPLTDEEEQEQLGSAATVLSPVEGTNGGLANLGISEAASPTGDEELSPKEKLERRTTYQDENAKWYKKAKKAEKKSGAPNMHLAL